MPTGGPFWLLIGPGIMYLRKRPRQLQLAKSDDMDNPKNTFMDIWKKKIPSYTPEYYTPLPQQIYLHEIVDSVHEQKFDGNHHCFGK